MNVKFVIPIIVEEVTDKCLKTYDLDWSQLVLVDNSKESFGKKYEGRGAKIFYYPDNLGVPASWNLGIKEPSDFLWIVSSSVIFNHGFSELIEKTQFANEWGLLTEESWHCIGFTRKTLDLVGMFDEKFYPAYYEDNDYGYRLKLADIHQGEHNNLPKVGLDVTSQGIAMTLKAGKVSVRFDLLEEYYKKKWGGSPRSETYTTPFNIKP